MMEDPSYHSFLVRLWRGPGDADGAWQGEVEHIQSGAVVEIASLEEAFRLIQRSTAEADERGGDGSSHPGPQASYFSACGDETLD
jgi:hypothetical protein